MEESRGVYLQGSHAQPCDYLLPTVIGFRVFTVLGVTRQDVRYAATRVMWQRAGFGADFGDCGWILEPVAVRQGFPVP